VSKEQKELTPRQWQLYKYLKEHYQPDVFIEKKELAKNVGYAWNDKSDRNGRDIESDVMALRESDKIQKIIVSSAKGYKIANEQECKEYLDKDWINIMKELKRHNVLRRKARKHKQMRIVWNSERDTIEAFMEDIN
jgi:hypothetical protein